MTGAWETLGPGEKDAVRIALRELQRNRPNTGYAQNAVTALEKLEAEPPTLEDALRLAVAEAMEEASYDVRRWSPHEIVDDMLESFPYVSLAARAIYTTPQGRRYAVRQIVVEYLAQKDLR